MVDLHALGVRARERIRKLVESNKHECVQLAVVTGLLLGFTTWFDGTTPHRLFEGAVYSWFQIHLALADNGKPLPVVVVDISGLDSQQHLDSRHLPDRLSPREQLRSLIDVIAAQEPYAIGIDVDFSREKNEWTERGGPQLFDHLRELRTKTYLGVNRTRYGKSEDWLGDARYKDLAVTLALPADDNRKLPLWIGTGNPDDCYARVANLVGETPPKSASGSHGCLFSMSVALALDYPNREHPGPCRWLCSAPSFEEYTIESRQINTELFMVNYGAVQLLRKQAVSGIDLLVDPGSSALANRIVILGNAQWETTPDKYPIPYPLPPWQKEVPGIFFHASGVYTLIKGPLHEITPLSRTTLDVLAVLICFLVQKGPLYVLRRFQKKQSGEPEIALRQDHARWIATWFVILLVLAFGGYGLLYFLGILWTDWPWVAITLLLHGWADRRLERWEWFQDILRRLGLRSEAPEGGVI